MPCNSDYLEASNSEINSRLACRLLCYLLPLVGREVPKWATEGAADYYGAVAKLNEATVTLCEVCRSLTPEQADKIIYDGRNPQARELATWWDEHQEADRKREAKEAEAARIEAAKASALAKLTPEERDAILRSR